MSTAISTTETMTSFTTVKGDTFSIEGKKCMSTIPELHRARRGHDFFPLNEIPALYATEATACDDKLIHAHYFSSNSDWYIAEYDAETSEAFGYVRFAHMPDCAEWGYFYLREMEEILTTQYIVERDV